jgi:UDP-N-acetyl-2-amino-2-deoxyglucuronate dehydrogenase
MLQEDFILARSRTGWRIMKKPVRFALVGCGRIAQRYLTLFRDGGVPGAKLVAVADPIDERRAKAAAMVGVRGYPDFHAMMGAQGDAIDVVCVLTPSGLHPEHVVALSDYGKHIVVEKPMALDLRDAQVMVDRCSAAGTRLFVVKQNRFNVPVVKLRTALEEGRFGRLVMGSVRVRWSRDQAYYDQDAWRGTWAYDGGVFMNQASHHVDLLVWMLGEPVRVWATARRALVDIETEDTGVAVITFANGAIGVVEATTATRPKDLEGSLSLLGSGGTVVIGGFAVNKLETWRFTETRAEDTDIVGRFSENPPDVYGYGHARYLVHVVEAIRTGEPALVEGAEGLRSLAVINAIYESIATGREVSLADFEVRHGKLGRYLGERGPAVISAAE